MSRRLVISVRFVGEALNSVGSTRVSEYEVGFRNPLNLNKALLRA